MKYFVTGATGFVGGHVARQLLEQGHEIVLIVRNPAKVGDLDRPGVTIHQGDVTEKESLRGPMEGVDGVFHIAGWYKVGVKDKSPGQRINVEGTRNVLEVMRELGIVRGVYTSTLAVNSDTHGKLVDEHYTFNGRHLSEYDRTKWAAHYEVAEPMIAQGLPLVIVMPGLIYGPGDTSPVRMTLIQYLRRKLPLLPANAAYSWAHVDDIARGHILAMEKGRPGESYIIAGPTHTLVEAMQMAEKITGIPAPRLHAAPWLMNTMAATMGFVEKFASVPETYSSEGLRSTNVSYIGSNAKARRELGYEPRSLEEGLAETLAHEMKLLGMQVPAHAY